MAVVVSVRARLRDDPGQIQALHDQVTGQTKEQARAAGDISHRVYLNAQDPRDFLGLDEWESAEAFRAFAENPQIQEFFGRLFEGQPEVTVWEDPGWNQW